MQLTCFQVRTSFFFFFRRFQMETWRLLVLDGHLVAFSSFGKREQKGPNFQPHLIGLNPLLLSFRKIIKSQSMEVRKKMWRGANINIKGENEVPVSSNHHTPSSHPSIFIMTITHFSLWNHTVVENHLACIRRINPYFFVNTIFIDEHRFRFSIAVGTVGTWSWY